MRRCYRCNTDWTSEKKQPAVKECCPSCNAYLHCCLNCRFYDEHAHNKCRIPTTDWVGDRAGPNFCDDFEFGEHGPTQNNAKQDQARDALGKLFGEESASPQKTGKDGLDALFGE